MKLSLLLLTAMFYTSPCFIGEMRVVAEDQIARNGEGASDEDPFVTGKFSWIASPPLIGPVDHGDDHCDSIKDPTIVRYDGRWHLFTTLRSEKRTHQIEYLSFTDWKDANQAERHLIDLTEGYHCAPQVFFYSPQQKWYMIHQIKDPTRKPSLQPAFSTSDDINNPRSWSKSKLLFEKHPENVKMWIDFWVICDESKAHLFFTSWAGWMWRSETSLDDFPSKWSQPKVVLKGDIFEASHTYRLKGRDQFLTLVEARNGGERYLKAFTAGRLDGKWSPLAASLDQSLASPRNVRFHGKAPHEKAWTSSFSHGEFLRSGHDQRLQIDPNDTQLLYQGVEKDTKLYENYGKIPWKLGLLTLDHDTGAVTPHGKTPRHATIQRELMGQVDEKNIYLYTLTNAKGVKAKIMNYGAILYSLELPDRNGKFEDVTLGYAGLDDYVKNSKYFGATIGRYGNRIAKGRFTLDENVYTLATNNGENHLHGGNKGFNKVVWDSETVQTDDSVGVRLTYLSKDGEEGYPGNLTTTVIYTLTNQNELKVEYQAQTDKSTPVNLTHHSFWNLAGNAKRDILDHELMLDANYYLPVNAGLIPTGDIKSVQGSPMDFTHPTPIGSRITQVQGGYDHNYVLNRKTFGKELALAARVHEPVSGRVMEIYTTEPGIQFYSGNFFDGSIIGKEGKRYEKYFAFCLETQHFPDSPNVAHFPSTLLEPGQTYSHVCVHKFYVD